MTDGGPRVLVIRGDLNSTTGYAHAISLYVERLLGTYDAVLGVDLHPHPDPLPRWSYPIITPNQLAHLEEQTTSAVDVLTISSPDDYLRVPRARNIGMFFWETDRLGRSDWVARINHAVDEMWVPAEFMVRALRDEGVTVPVRYRPCPLPRLGVDRDAATPSTDAEPGGLRGVVLRPIDDAGGPADVVTFRELRRRHRLLYLSTGTAIPRKGLPMLAHEWTQLAAADPGVALVLKVGAVDVTKSVDQVVDEVRACWQLPARRLGRTPTGVYVLTGRLPADAMQELSWSSDAFVTTSLGEGYGLGVFESLVHGRPAICPRHTALAELLPDDYPYFLETEWVGVGLADPVGQYPISARWGVPAPGSLAAAHERLEADRASGELGAVLERAVRHAEERFERSWERDAA